MSSHSAPHAATSARPLHTVPRTAGERLAWLAGRSLIHGGLLLIALIWLVPTVGLAVTSFRPRPDIAASGWWTVLQVPHFTWQNYQEVLGTQGMTAGAGGTTDHMDNTTVPRTTTSMTTTIVANAHCARIRSRVAPGGQFLNALLSID